MMHENALYAKAMAEQAKVQNKNVKAYLGNHYDLQMFNASQAANTEKQSADEVQRRLNEEALKKD